MFVNETGKKDTKNRQEGKDRQTDHTLKLADKLQQPTTENTKNYICPK